MLIRKLGVALLALVLVGGACAGDKTSEKPRVNRPTTRPASDSRLVVIDTFAFTPKVLRVHVGDTVRWKNNDNIGHTFTSGTREYDPSNSGRVVMTHKSGMFDTPLEHKGDDASFTFREAGTVHYFCDRHPGMEADIEVS